MYNKFYIVMYYINVVTGIYQKKNVVTGIYHGRPLSYPWCGHWCACKCYSKSNIFFQLFYSPNDTSNNIYEMKSCQINYVLHNINCYCQKSSSLDVLSTTVCYVSMVFFFFSF